MIVLPHQHEVISFICKEKKICFFAYNDMTLFHKITSGYYPFYVMDLLHGHDVINVIKLSIKLYERICDQNEYYLLKSSK